MTGPWQRANNPWSGAGVLRVITRLRLLQQLGVRQPSGGTFVPEHGFATNESHWDSSQVSRKSVDLGLFERYSGEGRQNVDSAWGQADLVHVVGLLEVPRRHTVRGYGSTERGECTKDAIGIFPGGSHQ